MGWWVRVSMPLRLFPPLPATDGSKLSVLGTIFRKTSHLRSKRPCLKRQDAAEASFVFANTRKTAKEENSRCSRTTIAMESTMESLRRDFASELRFYRKYHQNPINWALHAVCVPVEWFGWLVVVVFMGLDPMIAMLGCFGALCLSLWLQIMPALPAMVAAAGFFAVTVIAGEWSGVVVGTVVGLYYLALRLTVAHIASAVAQPVMGALAMLWVEDYGFLSAVLLHLGSWFLQVGVGHSIIEGNEPGMATALTLHAIVLSPLLAWLP